jgi:hypothetical protein
VKREKIIQSHYQLSTDGMAPEGVMRETTEQESNSASPARLNLNYTKVVLSDWV